MPYQTSYGYSGYNAVPAQSRPNVAMYAVGGALAGAAVGAGAMYAYNSMYGDAYGYEVFRRRRLHDFRSPDYCIVTAPGSRNGAFMECAQCHHLYGPELRVQQCTKIIELLSSFDFVAPEVTPSVHRQGHAAHRPAVATRPRSPSIGMT